VEYRDAAPILPDASPLGEGCLRFRITGVAGAPSRVRLRLLCTDATSVERARRS
jgi:hypothetical protein